MIQNKTVVAVITARSGSKGLPGKNIKPLAGKPLLQWPIETATHCPLIDAVLLSTDSDEYADIGRQAGAQVGELRPAELAKDNTASVPVVLHRIDAWIKLQKKPLDPNQLIVVLLEPTSPFTRSQDLTRALEILVTSRTGTAIVSLADSGSAHPEFCTALHTNHFIRPIRNYEKKGPVRRQEIENSYFFDGSFYISYYKPLLEKQTFYHSNTLGQVVECWQRFEIDTPEDFLIAEAIANNLNQFKAQALEKKI